MKCRDCKFWGGADAIHYGDLLNAHPSKPCAKQANMVVQHTEEDNPNDKMIPVSEWGDESWIITGPDFGCIHFEKNEAQ